MTKGNIASTNNMVKASKRGRLYALFLSILPIVMEYKTPELHYGLATILIAIGMLYAGAISIGRVNKIDKGLVVVLALYLGYSLYKSTGLNFLLPIAILVHISAISTGFVNFEYFRKYIETFSLVASLCVLAQQLIHITTGIHIPFINANWLTDELQYYVPLITSGYGNEAMYRPSAFFLEPSHFTQYVIYGLGSSLFKTLPSFKKPIILSLGLFATTSGMGFVLTFAIWGWWYLTYKRRGASRGLIKTVIMLALLMIAALALFSNIPFFAGIMSRFIGSGDSDYNAIDGRLFFWNSLFGGENFNSLLFGFGEQALLEEEVYFTGFMKILFAYGIVGFVFYAIFLLYLLFHMKNKLCRMYVIIYIGLLFVANLTGFINIIFFVGTTLVFSQIENRKMVQVR